jgi:anaerobic ribonucleoside-triphosphate reductase activating protein
MLIRLSSPITVDSIVDGPGLRTVIWTQGCTRNCPGCHNPQTHALDGGFEVNIEQIYEQLKNVKLQKGITLSGGDPFLQPEACSKIAHFAHSIGLDVWCFTGFTYEEILQSSDSAPKELLKNIDVLVDGPFVEALKSYDLRFKGSKNQRILHLKNGEIISEE